MDASSVARVAAEVALFVTARLARVANPLVESVDNVV